MIVINKNILKRALRIISFVFFFFIFSSHIEASYPPTNCNSSCGDKPDLSNWPGKPYKQCMVGISGWAAEDQAKGYSIPSSITIPAGVSGEIVLYYKSVDGSALASFEFNGRTFNVTSLDGNGRAIINTGLHVTGGETFTVNSKREGSWSLGWISPNSDRTCGSRFCGPPLGGICTPFVPSNVSADISWAESFGNSIISQQCWGDSMEWIGDYDFNDYLLIVTVKPDASCGDGIVGNTEGEECDPPGSLCTLDVANGSCTNSCKCCVECSVSCPNPLVSSAPVNPPHPHSVSEYFFDNITSCEDRSTCENPQTRYADCYEILSNQPTVSLNIHPELVPTTLSFVSDSHTGSGTYKENGTISDDTVNDFMPYSSIRYQNEGDLFYFEATFLDSDNPIESAYIWFSKSLIKPVTPKFIDLDNSVTPNKYGAKSNSEFGFLLYHNLNTDSWVPYVPAISGSGDSATDVWKQAKSYSDVEIIDGKTVFSVPASNGQKTAKVLLYSITPANSGKKIVVKFSISFKSSGEALLPKLPDEGRYNIWMMANDTFGFTPYDNYEEYSDIVKNAIKNKWITNERIRYYDQWIDSGKDWNLNFDIPGVNLMITPSESVRTGLDISWEFDGDSDFPDNEFSDLVINLYKTEELNIPDEITLSNIHNGGGEVDSNSPFQPKVDGQHTDRIGSLNVSNNYYLLKIHGGSGNGSATLNFGNVGQGKIYFYITVFDKGGNVGVLERSFNLSDWIITHGGLLYSKDVNFEINLSKEPDDWDEKPLLKSIKYDHADISTELVGIGSLGIPTSPVKSENTSSYMLRPYKVDDPKNGYYQTYKGYFDRRKTYIPNLKDLGDFDILQGNLSTLGSGIGQNEIASVETDGNLFVDSKFICDRRGVFFVKGDLTIEGRITNQNLEKDACIFVVNGNVTIDNGKKVSESTMEYDEINAYILADGKIEIQQEEGESIYDGIYIDGGMHSLNEEGVIIKRSLKLADRLRFPVLVVKQNSKYGVLSRSLFGSSILLQSIEVGVRP